jgi:RNA polymerase sigma-70 factor (ECF subfamily)
VQDQYSPASGIKDREAGLTVLLHLCAVGDSPAFQKLYKAEASRLQALAMHIVRDQQLATDAVHDAFVEVWRHAGQFRPELGNPGAWLAGIVRFRAIDIKRHRAREPLVRDIPDQKDEEPDALDRLVKAAEVEALYRSLGLLGAKQRQMLTHAYFDGLTHREIASKYDLPIGTVKSWVRRALLQLKDDLTSEATTAVSTRCFARSSSS